METMSISHLTTTCNTFYERRNPSTNTTLKVPTPAPSTPPMAEVVTYASETVSGTSVTPSTFDYLTQMWCNIEDPKFYVGFLLGVGTGIGAFCFYLNYRRSQRRVRQPVTPMASESTIAI